MKQLSSLILGVALFLIAGAGIVQADVIIDFSGAGAGGTVSWAGGTSALVGTNIKIGTLSGIGTVDTNVYNVTGNCTAGAGCLNFTTGSYIGTSNGLLVFGPSGSFAVTGSIDFPGTAFDISNGTLLNGTFMGATFNPNTGTASLVIPSGTDTKNANLLAFYGITSNQWQFGGTIQGTSVTVNFDTGFSSTTFSTDIPNKLVPEPSSLILLGIGISGLGLWGRKRLRK
jgi:hypothetical protein